MSLYRDQGVVLRTVKLGETDRIVTVLAQGSGKVRAVAKGVRKPGSRFGARLEPFMVADLQLVSGKSLDIVTQAVAKGAYGGNIAADYASYTVAAAMTETAEKLTDVDGEAGTAQYNLLVGALAALSRGDHTPELILDSYLLRALATGGWAPSFTHCARCGAAGPHNAFSAPLGGMVCGDCRPPGSAAPAAETVALLGALLTGNWTTADSSLPLHRREAAGLVASYLQWHLERVLKSLKHVERT